MQQKNNDKTFEDPLEKIHKRIDELGEKTSSVFDKIPPELQKVSENLEFLDKIKDKPLPPGTGATKVFGVETWDINMILKDNIWNRSIWTVDKLVKLFLKADLKQKEKYLKKRNPMDFNWLWLFILIGVGLAAVMLIILFLAPRLGI